MARKFTYKVLDLMDEGVIDPKMLAEQLAMWCSEDDMKEFFYANLADLMEEEEDFITE
jgi:hypothetical protein